MMEMWKPSEQRVQNSQMKKFLDHVESEFALGIETYSDLHHWSIGNSDLFWEEVFKFFKIDYSGDLFPAFESTTFEKYEWFEKVKLSFTKNMLKGGKSDQVAIRSLHESGNHRTYTYQELTEEVAGLQETLSGLGFGEGDVMAAYMPNIAETVISMLATNGLGGTFTSTSSDFGVEGVLDRFGQSRPKVLISVASYEYNSKKIDMMPKLVEVANKLESVETILVVDFLGHGVDLEGYSKFKLYDAKKLSADQLITKELAFSHPHYIMYSSGTTGKPKCIVHSQGGTLLQHVKELGLHADLTSKKNIMYFTTCGWMMWNWLVSSLYFGGTVSLYEGSPAYPTLGEFMELLDQEQVNIFGTSPKFLKALEDHSVPMPKFDHLETILSTGAPLLPEQFDYVYEAVKKDVLLASICGGTDILGCFMLGNPMLPVHRGEIQCLGLAMDVACFDEEGRPVFEKEGELVCKQTFPSRPLYFLGDENNERINKAYFNKFPGVWHHGDFVTLNKRGGVSVFGRSDATLNPGGVRIGTAEIYRQTERLDYLEDSICVGVQADGDVDVALFVIMRNEEELSKARIAEIKQTIKKGTTPRHTPRVVHAVTGIPYTRSGKKMELAVSRLVNGRELDNIEAVANPDCLDQYRNYQHLS